MNQLSRIIVSLILAFILSHLAVTYIWQKEAPFLRPQAGIQLASFSTHLRNGSFLPSIQFPDPAGFLSGLYPSQERNKPVDTSKRNIQVQPVVQPNQTSWQPRVPPPQQPTATKPPPQENPIPNLFERGVILYINEERKGLGLPQLKDNKALSLAAKKHSRDISRTRVCGNRGTDGSSPEERIEREGFVGSLLMAMVVCDVQSPQAVAQTVWSNPTYQAILKSTQAKSIGVGWYEFGTGLPHAEVLVGS